jgi:adenylate cyclase
MTNAFSPAVIGHDEPQRRHPLDPHTWKVECSEGRGTSKAAPSMSGSPSPDAFSLDLLGATPEFTSREVIDIVGIPMYRARRFWRALGFANVPDDEARFTSADVAALSTLVGLVRDGLLDEKQAVEVARTLGRSTARLAGSQADFMVKILDATGVSGTERSHAAGRMAERTSRFEELLIYSWRRHLAHAFQRSQPHLDSAGPTASTVGFADLVSFTRLSRQLSESQLAALVERFESGVSDLITAGGGRAIKSLGDEVLFIADDPTTGADIGIAITERVRRANLPGIRVGLEHGPLIRHAGDVFGDTVNLASRLTAMAEPNRVIIGPTLAAELADNPRYRLTVGIPTDVRGVGSVTPVELARGDPTAR